MLKKIWAPVLLATLLAAPVLPQQWTKKTPNTNPPAAYSAGMAYDAANSQILLSGGAAFTSSYSVIGTWAWDGATWQLKAPFSPDYPQQGPTMASFGNSVLMCNGGSWGAGPGQGTWKWSNNSAWTKISDSGPFLGIPFAMTGARDAAVGITAPYVEGSLRSSTWQNNGSGNWKLVSADNGPTWRMGEGIAYDAARNQVVVFGGILGESYYNDTWVYDGQNWTQKFPSHQPPARFGSSMAYDASAGQVVLFGGISATNTALGDTWTWDGTDWTQQFPANWPSPRVAPMAYDAARGQTVLYGGLDGSGNVLGDTWVWTGAAPSPYAAIVQQPINPNGSALSVFNANRGVVPVKFKLTVNGAPTCALPPATISVQRLAADGTSVPVNESDYVQAANSGSNFRIDQPNCQYVYNLGASSLGVGTYQVNILINGAAVGSAKFGLK